MDTKPTNRGLWFDVDMVPHGGHEYRVVRRAKRADDERSGRVIRLLADCVILDGETRPGVSSKNGLFCTRNVVACLREIWLEGVDWAPCC